MPAPTEIRVAPETVIARISPPPAPRALSAEGSYASAGLSPARRSNRRMSSPLSGLAQGEECQGRPVPSAQPARDGFGELLTSRDPDSLGEPTPGPATARGDHRIAQSIKDSAGEAYAPQEVGTMSTPQRA